MVSVLLFAVLSLIGRSVVGQNVAGSTGDTCQIPAGQFHGMIVDSNLKQPYYGNRCPVRSDYVQVRKLMCMPYYCCEEPCVCGNGSLKTQSFKCKNGSDSRRLSCFVFNIVNEGTVYGCCNGSEEDGFHVCATIVDCKANNGGCDQMCQHNATSGRDYCSCYPGQERQLLDSSGTTRCTGNGPMPTAAVSPGPISSTAAVTTGQTPSAAAVSTDPSGLPIPYIIAIAVALFLLLLLLLLLLFCCLRRRTQEKKVVVVVESLDQKVSPIVIFKDIESGKKEFDDDDDDKGKTSSFGADLRQENHYSDDPVTGKGGVHAEGQGQLTHEGLKAYDSLNFTSNMESDERIYEQLN